MIGPDPYTGIVVAELTTSNQQPNKFNSELTKGTNMTTQTIKSFFQDEAGQDLVEYSLLLGFLALGSLALLSTAGGSVKTIWTTISTNLTTAAGSGS
jgi:pilus assembly protein Flp/PilA